MTNPTVFVNSQTWIGCARETTRGQAILAPSFWVPATILSPRTRTDIIELDDTGDRGMMTNIWDMVQGPEYAELIFKCLVHVDVLPHLLRSILGSPDITSAGPGGSTYHAFSLLNNDGAADQPPSYTWFDWDGLYLRTLRGGQTDYVNLMWRADGQVEIQARVVGFQVVTTTNNSIIPKMPNIQPVASWDCTTKIAGTITPTVTKATLMMTRHVTPINTLGQQTAYSIFAGPLDIFGTMSVINQNDVELNYYLNGLPFILNMNCAQAGAVAEGFVLDMAATKSSNGMEERDPNGLITTSFNYVPLPNSTDATAGGYSPIKATVQNFTSSSY